MTNDFGSVWPYGCCTVIHDGIICGWPLNKNGDCIASTHGATVADG